MSECECVIQSESDHVHAGVCNVESPEGNLCSRPSGHDGPHSACNVSQHPIETWGGESDG